MSEKGHVVAGTIGSTALEAVLFPNAVCGFRWSGTARLDNIPWFVRGIACGDVVATEPDEEGMRWAGEVVRRSDNCTIRLIVLRDDGSEAARQSVLNAFHELGVCGEGIEPFRMVALDVPPTADLAKVQRLLKHGVAKEWWHMEEGCIPAEWRATSAG